MKGKLKISFSGGRTSAYMTWWLLNEWEDRNNWEVIVVFANTGKEHEKTLEFVERCAIEWDIQITWLEAVPISAKGWQVTHKVVSFETALGYKRLITYILSTEKGSSLYASNWKLVGEAGGGSWSVKSRPRVDTHPLQIKLLFEAV